MMRSASTCQFPSNSHYIRSIGQFCVGGRERRSAQGLSPHGFTNNQNTLILLLVRLPLHIPPRFLPKRSACQPINVKQPDQ
jgi:hypothetical protein